PTPSMAIGIEYIRLAAEQQLRDYYPVADFMYFWALSDEAMKGELAGENLPVLEDELARLEPLVDPEEYVEWQGMLDTTDPALMEEITTFWETVDLLPDHSFNIRLLEYWERIAFARDQYNRVDEPPYGTDERGRYYVAYGEPDMSTADTLMLNSNQIRRALTNILSREDPPGAKELDVVMTVIDMYLDESSLAYELWDYNKPDENMQFDLTLMFGLKADGTYGRIFTLSDFIPRDLFLSPGQILPGIGSLGGGALPPPSIFLHWLFYDQMSAKDEFYHQMISELDVRMRSELGIIVESNAGGGIPTYVSPVATLTELNRILEDDIYWKTYEVDEEAPEEFSTEEKKLPGIPIEIYQYRILDEQNRPALLSFVESYP
ncbi:MAG: GWxTD domain-containing protein, partial [Balneolaceae bacterium]